MVTVEKPEIELIPKIKITFFPSPWKPSVLQQGPSGLKTHTKETNTKCKINKKKEWYVHCSDQKEERRMTSNIKEI